MNVYILYKLFGSLALLPCAAATEARAEATTHEMVAASSLPCKAERCETDDVSLLQTYSKTVEGRQHCREIEEQQADDISLMQTILTTFHGRHQSVDQTSLIQVSVQASGTVVEEPRIAPLDFIEDDDDEEKGSSDDSTDEAVFFQSRIKMADLHHHSGPSGNDANTGATSVTSGSANKDAISNASGDADTGATSVTSGSANKDAISSASGGPSSSTSGSASVGELPQRVNLVDAKAMSARVGSEPRRSVETSGQFMATERPLEEAGSVRMKFKVPLVQASSRSARVPLDGLHRDDGEEVRNMIEALGALTGNVIEMAKVLVQEGKILNNMAIVMMCAFILMPTFLALVALIFMTHGKAEKAKDEVVDSGGLRALRESLKLTLSHDIITRPSCESHRGTGSFNVRSQDTSRGGYAAGAGAGLLNASLPAVHSSSLASPLLSGSMSPRCRSTPLWPVAQAYPKLPVDQGTEVSLNGDILPHRQNTCFDVLLTTPATESELVMRAYIRENEEECHSGILLENCNSQAVCFLHTGGAVACSGEAPPASRNVLLMGPDSDIPIASLTREDGRRVLARCWEGTCGRAEGSVLFEVLLDSQELPISILHVDGRVMAKITAAQGKLLVKATVCEDIWLAVAGVVAARKLASPVVAAG